MYLEFLPNEILLSLFDYLNGCDLLQAFYGLNSRFNLLLYNQYRTYHFQFQHVSKRHFNLICQQQLPSIADRVIALQLSDYKTIGQFDLFISYIPSLKPFTHLRSLTIRYLRSYSILIKFLDECHHLNSFTHLNLHHCHFSNDRPNFQVIIDKIWSLSKLTNCHFINSSRRQIFFHVPTIISTSLEYVTIFHSELYCNYINQLFEYTPRLKRLSTYSGYLITNDYIPSPHPMLTQLIIRFSFSCDISAMMVLLQSTPNLRLFDINIEYRLIDGSQWEKIIRHYLPKLQIFRLKMKKRVIRNDNIKEQANELINSFRSSFWIHEHQWFVRCYSKKGIICLYSLSSESDYYGTMNSWQWTCSRDDYRKFYSHMTRIDSLTYFDKPIASDIRLPNIKQLSIAFPIDDQFSSVVPTLNQLQILQVSFYTDTFQHELQALLDRAPYLHTLRINQYKLLPLQISLFQCTNASIRELNFKYYNYYFNGQDCLIFARSSLGAQCEILSLRINHRERILDLVKNLVHLRILCIYWNNDKDSEHYQQKRNNDGTLRQGEKLDNDEFIRWLKNHLPSAGVVIKDKRHGHDIIIWI